MTLTTRADMAAERYAQNSDLVGHDAYVGGRIAAVHGVDETGNPYPPGFAARCWERGRLDADLFWEGRENPFDEPLGMLRRER